MIHVQSNLMRHLLHSQRFYIENAFGEFSTAVPRVKTNYDLYEYFTGLILVGLLSLVRYSSTSSLT